MDYCGHDVDQIMWCRLSDWHDKIKGYTVKEKLYRCYMLTTHVPAINDENLFYKQDRSWP